VMREFSTKVPMPDKSNLVDTCGTGGDNAQTFNVSTAAAFVAAAAGARVAKHGGRSVSSTSGSADVLESLGVNLSVTPEQVAECIERVGVGFMFAPSHHSAMKYAAPVRRELGVRTIFNILGPLTNPAGAPNQVMGVFHSDLVGIQARVLQRLGSRHVMVVHGADGLDEISPSGETFVAELKNDDVSEYKLQPRQFGMEPVDLSLIRVDEPDAAIRMLLEALEGTHSVARDVVALNAGAAIYTAGITNSLKAGVNKAQEVIASGAARAKLDEFVAFTQKLQS